MKLGEEIKLKAKNAIICYLKEKRKSGSSVVEERAIYSDLKKEQELGTIEVTSGLMLIKGDIRNGDESVEITKQGGYTYYRYAG